MASAGDVRTSLPQDTASATRNLRLTGLAIAAAIAGMLVLAVTRGIWTDELYTLYFAHHDLPFAELYRQRWRIDPHPPLFYSWAWALIGLVGDDLLPLRLANSAGLIVFGVTLAIGRRARLGGRYLTLFALLVLSSPMTVVYFAELRSYFFQICFFASAVLFIQMLEARDRDFFAAADPGILIGLPVTLLLAANCHYFSGLFCFLLGMIAFLREIARRRFRAAALLVFSGAVALVPLALAYLSYVAHVKNGTSAMQTPALKGYEVAVAMVAIGFLANLAAAGFALLGWRARRASKITAPDTEFASIAFAALVSGLLVLTTLNLKMHFLIPRYLLQVIPLAAAPVALFAAPAMALRWFALVPANALLLVAATTAQQATNTRWEKNLPLIRAEVRACPATRILAYNMQFLYDPERRTTDSYDPRIAETIDYGYPYIAHHHGFRVELAPQPGAIIPVAGPCPTIVWLEANYQRPGITAAELAAIAHIRTDPAHPPRTDYRAQGDHALLILRPN